jgi:hypothetical protein
LKPILKVIFFFFTDLITNCESELFSKNSNFFADETLLSQLAEEPLEIEDDVSFDFLNLPNTLEYISQSHQLHTSQQPPQPQQQPKLQQNHQHPLSNTFLTSSTTLPQVTQKSPVLITSQKLVSSLPSLTVPVSASTSPPMTSPQNTLEGNIIHSSVQQRIAAPVCTVTKSPAAILLNPSGVGQSTQQQNQKASLTFSNIHNSPGQQQINLQSASVTAAALQNSQIQLQLQALKHQDIVKQSSTQNQVLALQSMRQLPTDNMQQVSTTFCFNMQIVLWIIVVTDLLSFCFCLLVIGKIFQRLLNKCLKIITNLYLGKLHPLSCK